MTVNIQKKKIYRIRKIHYTKPISTAAPPSEARRLYILLTFITAAGVFIGAMCSVSIGSPTIHGSTYPFTETLLKALSPPLIYLLLCFFAGLSLTGQPVGYILCLFKGMGAGFLSACIFQSTDYNTAVHLLPYEALSIVAVILAARECIRMSALALSRTFGNSEQTADGAFRLYVIKFIVIFAIAAATALLCTLLSILI